MMKPRLSERKLEKRLSLIGKSYPRHFGQLLRRIDAIASRGQERGTFDRANLRELENNTGAASKIRSDAAQDFVEQASEMSTQPDDIETAPAIEQVTRALRRTQIAARRIPTT
jgi:hypothetical protein